jgi:MFS family permease
VRPVDRRSAGLTDRKARFVTNLPSATEPGRRRGLFAAISCIAVFGAGMGFSMPLFALILEARGVHSSVIGLNAAMTFLGVILAAPAVPWAARMVGAKLFMLACLLAGLVCFALMMLSDSLSLWFVLRFGTGVAGSGLFTASEAWISSLAGDRDRGRIMAIYATVLSATLCVGPLLLPITGITGWPPIVANALLVLLAGLPLLATPIRLGLSEEAAPLGLAALMAALPAVLPAVVLFGLFEGATLALLPVWGVQIGLSPDVAASTLSAIYFGGIVLQLPLGWASDRIARLGVLRLCGVAVFLASALIPFLGASVIATFVVLFLWGGFAGALYPLALSMAGDRFRGRQLVAANAAVVMGYGFGALAGPVFGGAAMAVSGPHGLIWLVALAVVIFLPVTFIRERGNNASAQVDRSILG